MAGRQTFEQWFAEVMTDEEKDGKISGVSLVHLRGQHETEIYSLKFGARVWTAKELAQIFRHKAESYAEEIPGVQQFNLQAFYGHRDEAQAFKPFTINGQQDFHGGLATEGPTPQGFVQQLMRHKEVESQTYQRGYATLVASQGQQVNQLMEMNTNLMTTVKDFFELLQRLMLERATGMHDFAMKQLQYQRETKEREKWMNMLPAAASNLFGLDLVPQQTADTALIESMAANLDEEGMKRFMAANPFPQEVMAILFARFQKILKSRREEAEQRQQVAPQINPEQELAGNLPG